MAGLALEFVLLLALIVVNGLLAMSEIAIVSVRKSRLRQRARGGDRRAAAALELASHPTRFLSTVQVGISLIGILAGALAGARVAEHLAPVLQRAGLSAGSAEAAAVVLVVIVITFLNVVLGELVPKRLALADAERISTRVARPMNILARIGRPVVWLLGSATDLVLRIAGRDVRRDAGITEEELVATLAHAAERGVIEVKERQIIERLFRLSDRSVADVMTPAERIVCLALDAPADDIMRRIEAEAHGRYPVCSGGGDAIIGYVTAHDVFQRRLRGEPPLDAGALRDPHWVRLSFPALRLLHLFQASGVHIAIVRDDDANVRGLITLTDVLEDVVGELPDAAEFADRPLVERGDGSWLVDGSLSIDRLRDALPDSHRAGLANLTGGTLEQIIVERAAREIGPATTIDLDGLRFEVVDMDGWRIDKVLVSVRAAPL